MSVPAPDEIKILNRALDSLIFLDFTVRLA
jgi:hypothetical protein